MQSAYQYIADRVQGALIMIPGQIPVVESFDPACTSCSVNARLFYTGMNTLAGGEALTYPVIVYNVNRNPVALARNKDEYITVWNSDITNQAVAVLKGWNGPFMFRLFVRPFQTVPAYVIGDTTVMNQGIITEDGHQIITEDNQNLKTE